MTRLPRRVLITFLGKGQRSPSKSGYLEVTYDLDDRTSGRVFGIVLLNFLRRKRESSVDRLVVVGTPGSDWDILYEELGLLAESESALEEAAALSAATAKNSITPAELVPLAIRMQATLGLSCNCVVIGYGLNTDDQVGILHQLASEIEPEDRLIVDLTHGLRHLPMFGLIAMLYLKAARRATVEAVYYGAPDLRFTHPLGHAPVVRLDGLLQVAEWTHALQTFDKDGDYSVFAPLLRSEGFAHEAVVALRRAGFLERTARIGEARTALDEFQRYIGNLDTSNSSASLFAGSLRDRINWAKEASHYERQRRLAYLHLDHQDFLRAALFGVEAFITLVTSEQGGEVTQRTGRTRAKDAFVESARKARRQEGVGSHDHVWEQLVLRGQAFDSLNAFRHALVHVDQPMRSKVVEALRSVEKTEAALRDWFEILLPPLVRCDKNMEEMG